MSCTVKPDKKDGRLICAECKTLLPKGASWCLKCGPMTVQPEDRDGLSAADIEVLCREADSKKMVEVDLFRRLSAALRQVTKERDEARIAWADWQASSEAYRAGGHVEAGK